VTTPRERGGTIGLIVFALALAFGAAIWFDVGHIGEQLARLVSDNPSRAAAPSAASRDRTPPASPVAITQAWYLDVPGYAGADDERRAAHAPMLVYFQTRSCDLCRRVDRELLASPEMKPLLDGAVKVRVDVMSSAREQRLAQKLGALAVPALIEIDAKGLSHKLPLELAGKLVSPAQLAASCMQP